MKLTVTPIVLLPLTLLTLIIAAILVWWSWRAINQASLDSLTRSTGEYLAAAAVEHLTLDQFLMLGKDPTPFEFFAAHIASPSLLSVSLWIPPKIRVFPRETSDLIDDRGFFKAQTGDANALRHGKDEILLYVPINFSQRTGAPDGIIETVYSAKILSEGTVREFYFFAFFVSWVLFIILLTTAVLLRVFVVEPIDRLRNKMEHFMKNF